MDNPHGYRGVLLMFMRYHDNEGYADDTVFSREELGAITAQDVVDWFNF